MKRAISFCPQPVHNKICATKTTPHDERERERSNLCAKSVSLQISAWLAWTIFLGQMTEACCQKPTWCEGRFANAQSARHWRHESRRSEKATTVKLVQRSGQRGQTGFHAEAEDRKLKERPLALLRYALAAPIAYAEVVPASFQQRSVSP